MKVMAYGRETQSFPNCVCISQKLQEMVRQEEGVLIYLLPSLNQFFLVFLTTLGLCQCTLNFSSWDAQASHCSGLSLQSTSSGACRCQ